MEFSSSNAKKVEQFGLGIAVDHETVDAHQLFKTIERVATEPRYTNLLQMFYNLLKSTTFQLVAWRKLFYPNHTIDVNNRISSHIELKIGVPATKSGKLQRDYARLILDFLPISPRHAKPSVYKWFKRMLSSDRSHNCLQTLFL